MPRVKEVLKGEKAFFSRREEEGRLVRVGRRCAPEEKLTTGRTKGETTPTSNYRAYPPPSEVFRAFVRVSDIRFLYVYETGKKKSEGTN